MTDSPMGRIVYQYPMYSDFIAPKGHLTCDRRTHACFNYYIMCQKLLEKAGRQVEDQIRYEGEDWWDKPYGAIAKSVAMIYNLESPADFLHPDIKYIVEKQVALMGFPAPDWEYWVNISPDTKVTV